MRTFLNGMRSSSVDLEHGWMLIPDSERMKTVPVPVPMPEDAILEDEFMDDEPAPDTQEIPEVPPKVNSFAVSYCTMPDLMMAKECPEYVQLPMMTSRRAPPRSTIPWA